VPTLKEINDGDSIEFSLNLRIKQGNLGEVVKDSCMLYSSEAALVRALTKQTSRIDPEDVEEFVLQTESKKVKREKFEQKLQEINDADPIQVSLALRMKQGNLGEVVKDSCLLFSSEKALQRLKTGKSMAQIEEEEELAAFVLQTVSKGIKREPFVLNSKEIDNHDPIEESLSLRKKKRKPDGSSSRILPIAQLRGVSKTNEDRQDQAAAGRRRRNCQLHSSRKLQS